MVRNRRRTLGIGIGAFVLFVGSAAWSQATREQSPRPPAQQDYDTQIHNHATRMLEEGKKIFPEDGVHCRRRFTS